jgi:site-specific DNA-methyltransferase (adenine-specific)
MIELLHIDCMDYMKTVPDKYFDLAVVDPPYGIGFGSFNRTNKDSSGNRYKANKYKNSDWDLSAPREEYFNELFRVSNNSIIWGGNYFSLPPTNGFIFWYKKNPVSNFSDGEFAWSSFMRPAKCFEYAYYGNIEGNTSAASKIHPTQKPVKLYDWIYNNYLYCKHCNNTGSIYEDVAGDGGSRMQVNCEGCALGEGRNYRVLDTHLGSGSNAIAAHKAGNIDFVGCEIDKEYYDAAVKRFNNHKAQQVLF